MNLPMKSAKENEMGIDELLLWGFAALVAVIIYVLGSGPSNSVPNVEKDGFEK